MHNSELIQNQYGIPYLRMSHSSQGLFHGCKRKFEFTKFFPQPEKEEYWDTMTGSALHAGYQHFLVHRDPDLAVWEMMKNFDLRVHSFKEHEPKTLEACYSTLMALIHHNAGLLQTKVAEIKAPNGDIVPAIEVPFQINLLVDGVPYEVAPGLPVIYVGFIDAVLVDFVTGEFIVEDLKTTGRINNDPMVPYMYDEQAIPYSLVLKVALGQDFRQLTMRYLMAKIDLVSPEIVPLDFMRTTDLLQDWAQGLLCDLEEIKRHLEMNWWPRRASHCKSWNTTCKFFDVCGNRDRDFLWEYFSMTQGAKVGGEEIVPLFTVDLDLGILS